MNSKPPDTMNLYIKLEPLRSEIHKILNYCLVYAGILLPVDKRQNQLMKVKSELTRFVTYS